MSATPPPGQTAAPNDPLATAIHKVQLGIRPLQQACWRLIDLARVHAPEPDPQGRFDAQQVWTELQAELEALSETCSRLIQTLRRAAQAWSPQQDEAALARMASSPAREAELRKRIAQLDRHLMGLYLQLVSLCEQAATPLQQEWQAPQAGRPLHRAHVEVELEYTLAGTDPCYDDNDDNTLAVQELLSWSAGFGGVEVPNAESVHMQIHDNWLDYPHPWMAHQCWLTHDVLEHNHGHHPRMGLPALLRTGRIHVDVHAVRSYVFDLQTGQFVARDAP